MSAPVPVECGVVGRNVDGLLHPTLKPSVVTVENADVVRLELMLLGVEVGAYW